MIDYRKMNSSPVKPRSTSNSEIDVDLKEILTTECFMEKNLKNKCNYQKDEPVGLLQSHKPILNYSFTKICKLQGDQESDFEEKLRKMSCCSGYDFENCKQEIEGSLLRTSMDDAIDLEHKSPKRCKGNHQPVVSYST